jgi:hypothetical protein
MLGIPQQIVEFAAMSNDLPPEPPDSAESTCLRSRIATTRLVSGAHASCVRNADILVRHLECGD